MNDIAPPTKRPDPPTIGPERDALRGWLDYHRATLAWKCDGLNDADLRRQSMPPSTLSLLGLVRHMAEVERHWFTRVVGGASIAHVWTSEWDFQAAFDVGNAAREEAFERWRAEVEQSRVVEARIETLDTTFRVESWDCDVSLRTVMLHLIHEYARHNGHADLLRQGIDGLTGA